jgi:hypothetical protein
LALLGVGGISGVILVLFQAPRLLSLRSAGLALPFGIL